jgi:hypothetical protein
MLVSIAGPNLLDQSKGTFNVHAAGCGDIKRSRDIAFRSDHLLTEDVQSRVEVAELIYDNGIMQEDETGADYLFDFWFAPCCATLPRDS